MEMVPSEENQIVLKEVRLSQIELWAETVSLLHQRSGIGKSFASLLEFTIFVRKLEANHQSLTPSQTWLNGLSCANALSNSSSLLVSKHLRQSEFLSAAIGFSIIMYPI